MKSDDDAAIEFIDYYWINGNKPSIVLGVFLILMSSMSVFVFGTSLNLIGLISWPCGFTLLFLNYRKIKESWNNQKNN